MEILQEAEDEEIEVGLGIRFKEEVQFYNIGHASNAAVCSLTYVIEDNYPDSAADAVRVRESAMRSESILARLIRSTRSRLP